MFCSTILHTFTGKLNSATSVETEQVTDCVCDVHDEFEQEALQSNACKFLEFVPVKPGEQGPNVVLNIGVNSVITTQFLVY